MKTSVSLIFITLFYGTTLLSLHAEETLGRLADGRAFRTDSGGIQLIDHTAELELAVETLKRRLQAAENEIQHKENLISQLQQAQPIDIAADQNTVNDGLDACPPAPKLICPEITADISQNGEISPSVEEVLAQKDIELKKVREQVAVLTSQKEKDGEWFDQTLAGRDKEITLLKTKLQSTEDQLVLTKQMAPSSGHDSARAGLSIPPLSAKAALLANILKIKGNSEQPTQGLNAKSLRSAIKQEIALTRDLSMQRDNLFKDFSNAERTIQIRPSSAHSSSNRSLDQLQKDIEQEESLKMLNLMEREVSEIKRQISEDIELAKRVGKL